MYLTATVLLDIWNIQGNGATNGCCSKCWRDMQKNQAPPSPCKPVEPVVEEAQPMEVEVSAPSPVTETAAKEDAAAVATPTKKKKKKTSYKNLLADMMHGSTTRDIEKEKESLRKVTGGGIFSKIDKI
ncbi:hypothetical protein FisN_3Hh085 [Fistulifera solaris]|uniref:A20-type domain-containing protein n=1 Tax=Fistulifera solaris TaxID=1519565 RepID=A0A1Z5JNP1_FISSO|nr:hypothetical protein FisN_3Hh085 [Fistulifera solaris]|eukprot:GAX15614.1 hypothetical protein FisN_3Hh085 [Fistulifera solaris]